MQKLLVVLCLILSACTPPYGNYTKNVDAVNVQMADDSADELAALYPPASTRFSISQDSKDAYGTELLKSLREKGYALEEGSSLSNFIVHPTPLATASGAASSPEKTTSNKCFGYIVDQLGEGLYRVTIRIGSACLSRVYSVSGNRIAPAGAWSRKE
jgi:hypothetical protein